MENKQPIYALVTGACSGIGYQFARALAERKYNVILVSNREREIHEAAEQVARDYGVTTKALCLDLAQPDAAGRLADYCHGMDIEVLINNAGIFTFADLCHTSDQKLETYLHLHVETVTRLTLHFAEQMKQRHKGYILNSSSLAGYFPFPGIALYTATKGYIRLLSQSLHHEYRPFGVQLLTLCPGAVATDLYGLPPRLQLLGIRLGIICRPEKMVRKALSALFRGRRTYIPYPWINQPLRLVVSHLPKGMIQFVYRYIKRFQKEEV